MTNNNSSSQHSKQGFKKPCLEAPKRRSIKKRIWQRVIFALIFSFGVIFAQEMGWLDQFAHKIVKQKVNWLDNHEVINYLKTIVTDDKLTDTPLNCLVFIIDNDDGGDKVKINLREKHNQFCINTRTDFPILFTFQVNRSNGNIQIDKGSPNHFYPIH